MTPERRIELPKSEIAKPVVAYTIETRCRMWWTPPTQPTSSPTAAIKHPNIALRMFPILRRRGQSHAVPCAKGGPFTGPGEDGDLQLGLRRLPRWLKP